MPSLDDILVGKKVAAPEVREAAPEAPETPDEVEQVEAPAPAIDPEAPKSDRPRDETGKFVKGEAKAKTPEAEEQEAATPAVEKPKEVQKAESPEAGLKAGITAERKKRQEYESRASKAEKELAELRASMARERPSFQPVQRTPDEQARVDQRVNDAVELARDTLTDWDEVMGANMEQWAEVVNTDPSLIERAYQAKNPAKFAYQQVKQHKLLQRLGSDPDAYLNAEVERILKEREPEYRKQIEASLPKPEPKPVPPPSLASASSASGVKPQTWTGPKPLNSILNK